MNQQTKLLVAKLFRQARQYIKYHEETYVCMSLVRAYRRHDSGKFVLVAADGVIYDRLDGHFTVQNWLQSKHPHLKKQLTEVNMRLYRLAWIDSLIKEFDPKNKTI